MNGNARFTVIPSATESRVALVIAYQDAEQTERFGSATEAGERILQACKNLDKEKEKK